MFGKKWNLRKRSFSPTQIIAFVFAAIILVGAVLLSLPAAARDGRSCGFLSALFTATSATCVTGLVLFDTWTQFSGFGQTVILCLIEVGGLGFMSAASLVVFALRKKVGLRQRMLMAQALSVSEMQSVVALQKWVLVGSLSFQAFGALILFLRFLPEFGLRQAVIWGVFHAVSAFCNAGFDIFGSVAPGENLIAFQNDPVVCLTLMGLVIVGGLGFFVWEEVATVRSFRKFSVYTKLVLISTGALLVGGTVSFLALEWNNPATLGPLSPGSKVLNAFVQAVTLRTAGFASVDQAGLTEAGKAVSILFMLIGGNSGSTAGGMKTVTVMVLLLFILSRIRGRHTVNVFRRQVPADKVLDAVTLVTVVMSLCVAGAVVICVTSPVTFVDALFETASALATVGLTAGVTPLLSVPAQLMIILFMYFGRVGVLTISLGFLMGNKAKDRFEYATTNLLIG